jgi:hypothetical protein
VATKELQIVHLESGEVVETIDVSDQSERDVERVLSGLLINMNTDEYAVNEVE